MYRHVPSLALGAVLCALLLSACGQLPVAAGQATSPGAIAEPGLVISAIPDQDPEKLQRLYATLARYLAKELGVHVEYKAVTDYTASVTAFKVGELDLVWYGGLTGVQARLQVPGAQAIAQRDIDASFHSVFIANKASGITTLADVKGRTFTFGSETSTSGRLMPQYFLSQAGVKLSDFKGEAGFSGSHDKTIQLVTAGTFDAGALNEQVWKSRLQEGAVDTSSVGVFWTSPAYHDYHWVVHPSVIARYGDDFVRKLQNAFFALDPAVPEQQEILDLFGAQKFVATENSNYQQIEAIGREIRLITSAE